MADRRSWGRYLVLMWHMVVAATLAVLSVLLLTLSSSVELFLAWQAAAVVFAISSLVVPRIDHWAGRWWGSGWATILPLLAGMVGVQLAVWALLIQSEIRQTLTEAVFTGLFAVGVLLSWLLIHIGFAEIYALIDHRGTSPGLAFPGEEDPTVLKYIYFSVTIGTSFAVSDVTTLTRRARTVVIIHSVVSFAYNALVVAVAFQVLQGLVASSQG